MGERRETKDLGPGGSPGKHRPRALRGPKISLRNRNYKYVNFCLVGSPERKRTKQGESDIRYKEGEKHGETRAMQAAWLEQKDGPPKYTQKGMSLDRNQPARSKWLQDGGLGEDNLYYLCCSIYSTKVAARKFQSRSQNIISHEASQLHQRAALKWHSVIFLPNSHWGKWLNACPKRGRYGVD